MFPTPQAPWLADIHNYPQMIYTFEVPCGLEPVPCGLKPVSCKLKRMPGWNWNGYITLPKDHPCFQCDCSEINVHGGITYTDSNGTYGFDTMHGSDLIPVYVGNPLFPEMGKKHFWTFEEVKAEVIKMAQQFNELAEKIGT